MRRLSALVVVLFMLAACGEASPVDPAAVPEGGTLAQVATTATTTTTTPANDDAEHMDDDATHMDDDAEHMDDEAAHMDDDAEHMDDDAAHTDDDAVVADREIEITLSDFAFEPGAVEVTAGESVKFMLTNVGVIEHEFRLTTEHAAEEHVASGHAGHDDEAASGHGHGEVIVLVPAGESESVVVTFDEHAEFDVVACLIPGHFEAGMHVPLEIVG